MKKYTTEKKAHKNMKSEIEKNKAVVAEGDVIVYSDTHNFMAYLVIENFGTGIEVRALSDECNVKKGQCEDLYFHELQLGWEFSGETKKYKRNLMPSPLGRTLQGTSPEWIHIDEF